MLGAIRKRSGSILVKLLLGLLVLSFGAWGITDVFQGRAVDTSVARVGDREITPDQLGRDYQRELARLQTAFGGSLDRQQARAMGLVQVVLDRIVERTLFGLGADRLGVAVSDDLVRREISATAAFQNQFKTFDRLRFEEVLRNNGLSESGFVAMLREDLARSQLAGSVEAGAVAPKVLVDALFRHRQEKRIAEMALIADDSVADPGVPDESALVEFHKKNAARFTAPEFRALTVLGIDAKNLAKEVAVSEDALKAAYEDRRDEFGSPERRTLQQMVLADEAAVGRAHTLVKEGRDFAEVAKEVGGLDAETLDLGTLTREELLPELAEGAFSVAAGEIVAPVQSPIGWHLMRVAGIEPASLKSFAEARGKLAEELAREKAIDSLFQLSNQMEDGLAGGATLEETASRLNLERVKIDAIDASGRDAAGQPVRLPFVGKELLDKAFSTEENAESPLTEAGSDGFFVVRVDRVTPPALRPLEEVREAVVEAWGAARRVEATQQAATALLRRVEGGMELSEAAAESGLTVTATKPFGRSSQDASHGLPSGLVTALFVGRIGKAAMARGAKGHYVARVKEVVAADPYADADGLAAHRKQLEESVRADLVAQLAGALRERYPVTVNRAALEQIF